LAPAAWIVDKGAVTVDIDLRIHDDRTVILRLVVAPAFLLCALSALVGCNACSRAQDPLAAGVAGNAAVAGTGGSALVDHNAPAAIVIVVLGSSTAAGTGPKRPENTWVERYRTYLKARFPKFTLTNLAVGGYTTYQMQPSDYTPPGNLPKPDKNHNITAALALKPNAIIINMPSNDTNANYPAADQLANFDRVTKLAGQNGALCWVTTSQPRNFTGDSDTVKQTKHTLLMTVRDATKQKYGDHTLDFWTQFADASGNIKSTYDAGDGTHMSDDAHALLLREVINAKIPEAVLAAKP
jgi:lysophospholipase L1-like esterase